MNERYKGKKHKNPVKAIREHCIECMGGRGNGYSKLIKECPSTACSLYDFRLGTNPHHSQNLTDEQKKQRAERLKKNISAEQGSGKVAQISIISPTPTP
jgi:hypothetical protein